MVASWEPYKLILVVPANSLLQDCSLPFYGQEAILTQQELKNNIALLQMACICQEAVMIFIRH